VSTTAPNVDLAEVGARIQSLTARLAAIGDGRELAVPVEEACNAGYGTALVLDSESRRARRGIVSNEPPVDLELVRTLEALELASRELRRSLAQLRERADWLPAPSVPGL
jgi:hypothetical protein